MEKQCSLRSFHPCSKRAETVGVVFHPRAQKQSIPFHLISSYPKQQLANPHHHNLNHIQHLTPWFTIHYMHSTQLVSFLWPTLSPLILTHPPKRLPGFEANLFTVKCALQRSVKVKRYQSLGLRTTDHLPLRCQCGHSGFSFSTDNGNNFFPIWATLRHSYCTRSRREAKSCIGCHLI